MIGNKRELYIKDSGKIFIIAFLVLIIAQTIVTTIIRQDISDTSVWVIMLINQATFLLVTIIYLINKKIKPFEFLGFKNKLSAKQWILLPILTIVLMIASSPLALMFSAFIQSLGYTPMGYFPAINTLPYMLFAVLMIAILPSIAEEVLFRGAILRGLKRRGYLSSALISALLFALIHSNPEQLVHQFILGLVFAITMQITNNIIAPMIMHFTNNFIAIFLDSILTRIGITEVGNSGFVVMILMVVIGSIFTVICIRYMAQLEKDKRFGKKVIDVNEDNIFKRLITQFNSIIKYLFKRDYRKEYNERYEEMMYQLDTNRLEEADELEMTQLEWILHKRNDDFKLVKIAIIGTSILVFLVLIIGFIS